MALSSSELLFEGTEFLIVFEAVIFEAVTSVRSEMGFIRYDWNLQQEAPDAADWIQVQEVNCP